MRAMSQLTITDPHSPVLEEQIRSRAYDLYEQRGKVDGYEIEDWLLAEAEIKRTELEAVAA